MMKSISARVRLHVAMPQLLLTHSDHLSDHRGPGPRVARSRGLGCRAFPLGGIGTGNVSIGARGELRDWEIANHPDKGTWLPFTFFAIRPARTTASPVSRVLEARIRPPHEGDSGHHFGKVAGLPRLGRARCAGEYPAAHDRFHRRRAAGRGAAAAFTPLVPLDADALRHPGSGAALHGAQPAGPAGRVTVAGSMSAPDRHRRITTCSRCRCSKAAPGRRTDGRRPRGLTSAPICPRTMSSSARPPLTTADPAIDHHAAVGGRLLAGRRPALLGRLHHRRPARAPARAPWRAARSWAGSPDNLPRLRTGSLGVGATLAAGETRDFEFFLTWHFAEPAASLERYVRPDRTTAPTRPSATTTRAPARTPGRSPNGLRADLPASSRRPGLPRRTVRLHPAAQRWSTPSRSTLVVAAQHPDLLLDETADGRFAAWEGQLRPCRHMRGHLHPRLVYAQTVAWLFPALERSARRVEFLHETVPRGAEFRANPVFGGTPWIHRPGVDGQLGSLLRLYREWRFIGRRRLPPRTAGRRPRALEFAFTAWDSDGDGLLDGELHNTYDIEFHGIDPLANSMFAAALRRAPVPRTWASGPPPTGSTPLRAGSGGAWTRALERRVLPSRRSTTSTDRYQYGEGCLSDQLLGQSTRISTVLGDLLPPDRVRSASERSSATTSVRLHGPRGPSALRPDDDAGLLLAPGRGRPAAVPFVYSDEVWTGIEHQVAASLVYEGLVGRGAARSCAPSVTGTTASREPLERDRVRQPLRPVAGEMGTADRLHRRAMGCRRRKSSHQAAGGGTG